MIFKITPYSTVVLIWLRESTAASSVTDRVELWQNGYGTYVVISTGPQSILFVWHAL